MRRVGWPTWNVDLKVGIQDSGLSIQGVVVKRASFPLRTLVLSLTYRNRHQLLHTIILYMHEGYSHLAELTAMLSSHPSKNTEILQTYF